MTIARTPRLTAFLETLRDGKHDAVSASDVAIVVAHPDDETICCGALISRLRGVLIVVVTDGAPRNLIDAQALGFASVQDYAEARTSELLSVMQLGGIHPGRLVQLGIADQDAGNRLPDIVQDLGECFTAHDTRIVLTHAYEGGHPDHDAVAFCVHQAAENARFDMAVLEMPFYRAGEPADLHQSFVDGECEDRIVVALSDAGRTLKRQMFDAYKTQKHVLADYSLDSEQFRVAPRYDFLALPNSGRLLYERQNRGMTGLEWQGRVRAALGQGPSGGRVPAP
ncbi:MAG TPA: PIG-L family deacetylase [Rhizomicrobium sp.]|jgi:LmbE family N-acetylglucosaminyl deacetylase